jgi:hypothetical protein
MEKRISDRAFAERFVKMSPEKREELSRQLEEYRILTGRRVAGGFENAMFRAGQVLRDPEGTIQRDVETERARREAAARTGQQKSERLKTANAARKSKGKASVKRGPEKKRSPEKRVDENEVWKEIDYLMGPSAEVRPAPGVVGPRVDIPREGVAIFKEYLDRLVLNSKSGIVRSGKSYIDVVGGRRFDLGRKTIMVVGVKKKGVKS